MSFQTAMLATLVILFGVAQYALCIQSLRDLMRRARVRGNNKVLWALVILCVPIVGALTYNWMGPTSFRHRPLATTAIHSSIADDDYRGSNVTPITAAPSVRKQTRATGWPSTDTTGRRTPGGIGRGKQTGS
jgi:uncharacterized membrane protein YcjF (UPF0283 family)